MARVNYRHRGNEEPVNPSWFTSLEQHITFGGVIALVVSGGRYWMKERDVYKRIKSRVNELWWDRCAHRQDPYTPVDNGIPAVVPPRPIQQ